ncbi:hypothetical protein [Methyloraptor flagellatus]|uniref:Glycosyltransferase n=1 Tax=Methyloraptor flagellatus TaxID=3162530 RepID=A0AAU7X7C0_9HYPH
MGLTILSIAYTHAPVGPDVSGGAEQILHLLDRALVARGHRSVVVAQAGSSIAGELVAYRGADGLIDGVARAAAERRARAAVDEALLGCRPDVVHMHGIDFATTLPPAGPRWWYRCTCRWRPMARRSGSSGRISGSCRSRAHRPAARRRCRGC